MKYLLAALMLVSSFTNAEGFRFGIDFGRSDIQLDSSSDIDFSDYSQTVGAFSSSFGYQFNTGFLVEAGASSSSNDILFGANDNITLHSADLLVGYYAEKNRFYFEPKIALSYWDLHLKEGEFLSPGDETEINDNGLDPMLVLTAGYKISKRFGLSLSYRYIDIDYGDVDSYLFGLDFTY